MTSMSLCAVKQLVTSGFPLQWITGVELWWSSVRRFHRRWIPRTNSRLDVFFYVCLNKLFNKQYSCQWVEIPGRVRDAIVMCHLSIRHTAWLNFRMITLTPYMVLPLFATRFADYACLGHPSLFHTAMTLLIWYKMFCMRDTSYRLKWMEFINTFCVYAQFGTHSRFNW